jgi:hypothetical protein
MGSLIEAVQDQVKRPLIIQDCEQMINQEVADKRGLTGVAVKAAFKAIRKFKPTIIPSALEDLVDEFAVQVEPFWQDCQSEGSTAEPYFVRRKDDIANALLQITDAKSERSPNRVLVKAYSSLRGKAIQHIGAAMPRFSRIVERHAS